LKGKDDGGGEGPELEAYRESPLTSHSSGGRTSPDFFGGGVLWWGWWVGLGVLKQEEEVTASAFAKEKADVDRS